MFAGRPAQHKQPPTAASPPPPDQETTVKCTYAECDLYFEDERNMIAHKIAFTKAGKHDLYAFLSVRIVRQLTMCSCPKCPRKDEDGNVMRDEDDNLYVVLNIKYLIHAHVCL